MSTPTREEIGGTGRTLVVTLGLAALLVALALLVRSAFAARTVPAEEALADWIEPGPLPFGLVPEQAVRQGGDLFVSYANPAAPAEAPRLEVTEKQPKGRPQPEPYDWSTLELGPAGTAPIGLLAVRYGRDAGERIEALFEPPRTGGDGDDEISEIKTFDAGGGQALMDRDRLRWFDYEVLFVHRRQLERGGTFRDVIQVNLSLPGRPLVLHVRWPRGFPASRERLAELLAALRPVERP